MTREQRDGARALGLFSLLAPRYQWHRRRGHLLRAAAVALSCTGLAGLWVFAAVLFALHSGRARLSPNSDKPSTKTADLSFTHVKRSGWARRSAWAGARTSLPSSAPRRSSWGWSSRSTSSFGSRHAGRACFAGALRVVGGDAGARSSPFGVGMVRRDDRQTGAALRARRRGRSPLVSPQVHRSVAAARPPTGDMPWARAWPSCFRSRVSKSCRCRPHRYEDPDGSCPSPP